MSQLVVNAGGTHSVFNKKFVNKQQMNLRVRLISAMVTKELDGVNEILLIL
jgi:hypothetical protein